MRTSSSGIIWPLRFARAAGMKRGSVQPTVGRARRFTLALERLEDRTVPALLGQQLFPADNPWNQRITDAPVAANSAAIMNAIVSRYGDGRLHPDFGQDSRTADPLYGIP